jgi:hypothetical protein
MEKDKLQELLPEGLVLKNEIANIQFNGVSFEAEDQRYPDLSISRVITFLERSNCNDWQKNWEVKFGERLKVLATTPMRHVVRPLEVRRFDGIDCVITDHRDPTIRTLMHAADNVAEKLELFQQLLEGIEELHRQDIVHGAICADYVQYSRHANNSIQCQLVSTEWGMVHAWAKGNGREINDDLKKYYPPEWNSGPEGSREGDVYAAGIIGCELFADAAKISVYKNDQQELRKDLRDKNLPKFAINVICGLVGKNIQNIQDALEKCQKQPIPPLKIAIWSVVASCLLTSGGFWVMLVAPLQSQNNELNDSVDQLIVSVKKLEDELSNLKNRPTDEEHLQTKLDNALLINDALEAKIREYQGGGGEESVPPEVDRIWKAVYDDPKTTLSTLKSKLVAESAKSKLPIPKHGLLESGLRIRYADFEKAAIFWRKMANDPEMKFVQMSGAASRAQKADKLTTGALVFVDQWIGDYEDMSRKEWKIRLGKATYANCSYNGREMSIEVDGKAVKVPEFSNKDKWDHYWTAGAETDYSKRNPPETITVSVPKDKSIALLMEADYYWIYSIPVTTNLLNREHSICTGPVAMWRFHMKGQAGIDNKDSQTTLYLTVKDIAGPRWEFLNPADPLEGWPDPDDPLENPEDIIKKRILKTL